MYWTSSISSLPCFLVFHFQFCGLYLVFHSNESSINQDSSTKMTQDSKFINMSLLFVLQHLVSFSIYGYISTIQHRNTWKFQLNKAHTVGVGWGDHPTVIKITHFTLHLRKTCINHHGHMGITDGLRSINPLYIYIHTRV